MDKTYKEYIEGLSKEELQHLILGSDGVPPLLTRDEPTYSRPQIIWALMRMKKLSLIKPDKLTLEQAENFTEKLINEICQHKWDLIFNYDYVRFDMKKPGFWYFIILNILGIVGFITLIRFLILIIIPIFGWIFK